MSSTCPGDCNGDGQVTINEVVLLINIDLDEASLSSCQAGDRNLDGTVTIEEILAAINSALNDCPQ